MKLERHVAVVIGDGLEPSPTALHGRGNARLAEFFARCEWPLTLVTLVGARRSTRNDAWGWDCVVGYANGLRGACFARVRLSLVLAPYWADRL
jgi:hypothetical protein